MITTSKWSVVDYGGFMPRYKYPPADLKQLKDYPLSNPLFVTIDRQSFNYIQRLKGLCLLCDKSNDFYDLSFTYQREIWLLYSQEQYFSHAMHLARNMQLAGAKQISAILIDIKPWRN